MSLSKEAEGALRAMKRAVKAAQALAAEKKLMIPVWRDGKVVHLDPNELAQQGVGSEPQ